MRMLERLDAEDLVAVVAAYRDALRLHQERINRLNVYPVPDGDTGTNMALTLESVVSELDKADRRDMSSVAKAIAHGSLMGARGNSGVILSQIMRGFADSVDSLATIDGPALAQGIAKAAEDAYQAVQQPVEGTILTVVRAAAEAASGAATDGAALPAVLQAAHQGAAQALERTPEMLPALRSAGVVDSGGSGLLLFFDAFLYVCTGRSLPEPSPAESRARWPQGDLARPTGAALAGAALAGAGPTGAGPGQAAPTKGTSSAAGTTPAARERPGSGQSPQSPGCRYEVMYLLEAPDESVPSFRDVWAGIGDSIVVVGGKGTWNCHIHTDDIGAAIEAALEAGRPRNIRVSDLWDEVEEERWVREAEATQTSTSPALEGSARPLVCGVVAVCSGQGITRIFHSLGVSQTVAGGPSMNPSTAELLAAIEAVPADQVVVLPNNSNIVAVARQAAERSPKTVRVLPTRGVAEGFAALLQYDPQGDADANLALMEANIAHVAAGEVARAVRDSHSDAGEVHAGDFIGVSREGIVVVAPTLADAATGLLHRLASADHQEIVTVIAGEGSTAADTRRITEWVADHRPGMSVEVHQGGQPLYPYLLSVE